MLWTGHPGVKAYMGRMESCTVGFEGGVLGIEWFKAGMASGT
jgi:hypothetical protein